MKIDRRKFLYLSGASISAVLLSACDSQGPDFTRGLLRFAQRQNEKVERALFRHRAIDIGSQNILSYTRLLTSKCS